MQPLLNGPSGPGGLVVEEEVDAALPCGGLAAFLDSLGHGMGVIRVGALGTWTDRRGGKMDQTVTPYLTTHTCTRDEWRSSMPTRATATMDTRRRRKPQVSLFHAHGLTCMKTQEKVKAQICAHREVTQVWQRGAETSR